MLNASRVIFAIKIAGIALFAIVLSPPLISRVSAADSTTAALPVEAVTEQKGFCDLQQPAFSSDGELLAYALRDPRRTEPPTDDRYSVVTASGVDTLFLGCDIWVTTLRTGEAQSVTGGIGTNTHPAWSPDGKTLAFLSDRGGEDRIWLWERGSGRLRTASEATVLDIFGTLVWTSDGKKVAATTALPQGMSIEDAIDIIWSNGSARDRPGTNRPPLVLSAHTSVPFDDRTTQLLKLDVVLIDIATGNVERPVRSVDTHVVRMSPDGHRFVFWDFKRMGNVEYISDLTCVDLRSGRAQVLVQGVSPGFLSWSPDSRSIVYHATSGKQGGIFLVSADGGAPRQLTSSGQLAVDGGQAPIWDRSGAALYAQGTSEDKSVIWRLRIADRAAEPIVQLTDYSFDGLLHRGPSVDAPQPGQRIYAWLRDRKTDREGIYRVNLKTHQMSRLLSGENRGLGGALFSPDGAQIIWKQDDALHPTDLWIADAEFRHPKQLTHLNPQIEQYTLGRTRLIDWRTAEGKELHGGLILPVGYQEGRRYPMVVYVYGGVGISGSIYGFSGDQQLLATRGYVALFADSFITNKGGKPMQEIAQSVLPGIEKAIALGIADPNRIGVTGHSYGAYSTLALIVQSTRFKAAVSVDGVSDLLSAYGVMDPNGESGGVLSMEDDQGNMGGSPWQYRDRYIENSPFFFLDRVQTPVLLIHGAADNTVMPWLGDQTFVGLRRLGKEVTYVKYPNGGHSPGEWRYADRVDYLNRVIGWFDKYLRAGEGAQ